MKTFMMLLLGIFLTGCMGQDEILLPDVYPRLKEYGSVYYPGSDLTRREITVFLVVFINDKGDVKKAELRRSTGSSELDDTILSSVLNWKYSPAESGGKAVGIWISQKITVQFQPLMTYLLAEIIVPRETLADSIRQQLQKGQDFEILAKEYSLAESGKNGGFIGKVVMPDLHPGVRRSISRLQPGEYTDPIPFDHQFAIYKRIR
jgi:TonB family protein